MLPRKSILTPKHSQSENVKKHKSNRVPDSATNESTYATTPAAHANIYDSRVRPLIVGVKFQNGSADYDGQLTWGELAIEPCNQSAKATHFWAA